MAERGLRERKKEQTRQHISDVATFLFVTRGFDEVSVAEVAEAAEVSKMTVFNYFPRKEDLMLDRQPEMITLITDAVRQRTPETSPLAALRELAIELARTRHPTSGLRDGVQPFFRTVLNSPALLARVRELQEEIEEVLAEVLTEVEGHAPGSPVPRLLAGWVSAAYRTAFALSARHLLAGEPADAIAGDHAALLNRAFDALDAATDALRAGG